MECLGNVHRILTEHRVNNEQDLIRLNRIADVPGLLHHLFVNTQATCGVDNHNRVLRLLGKSNCVLGNLDRVTNTIARLRGKDWNSNLLPQHLKLGYSVWALQVSGNQNWCVVLLL